jgi:serine/threonine protein kinase
VNTFIVKLYGVTQDPETNNYMMVLDYADYGSLRNNLDTNYDKLNWDNKLYDLWRIAVGIEKIHEKGFIHRDLHSGNILSFSYSGACITDMGLCKPAGHDESESIKNSVYGVLPYIAPEVLRGQNYTKASDIYSFGIIIYEVISGLPPYHDVGHDKNLAIKICQGFRPRFNIKVPQLILHLIKRCLDADPSNRPTAEEIKEILWTWRMESDAELMKQIQEAESINSCQSIPSTSLKPLYKTHSEATYTSRLLYFDDLPGPKNSDDYYDNYDDIISTKFSGN